MSDLIKRLRDTASKGVSVWGDLQMEAAKEIEILTAEREAYASAMDRMKTRLAEVERIDPMTAVADRFAHRLALALECVLFDKDQPTSRWWDEAMQLIGEYRSAMNEIHEQHSPTFMGEPVLKEQP